MPFSPLFWGEGSPTKLDYRKQIGYHSNLQIWRLLDEGMVLGFIPFLTYLSPHVGLPKLVSQPEVREAKTELPAFET